MNILSHIPLFKSLANYSKASFGTDLKAGLTVGVLLIPQAMAYAMLAGVPPIFGLYGALVPLLVYGLLASSRQLSIGPVAVSALLILAGVSSITEPESRSYVENVITLGLMVGTIQFTLGLFRFGFLVNFLSHPVISGFISAAAVIIIIAQLKDITGINIPRGKSTLESIQHFIKYITETHTATLFISLISFFILIIVRRIKKGFPTALILVLVGTALSYIFNWSEQGVHIIGQVPHGLPPFYIPLINTNLVLTLLPVALSVALIGLVESMGIAKHLEAKHKDHVLQPNQELMALGLSKIVGSFWQAIPGSGSFSRSAINSEQGGKSQVSNLMAAALVGLALIFLTPLFFHMPRAILAAIILQAVMGLFDLKEAKHLWQMHRLDFGMWMSTFIITLLLGIEEGVATGVILSIMTVLFRSSKPHVSILGNVPGTSYYRNLERFEDAERIENMLILRFDSALYFGNSNFFRDKIKELLSERPEAKNVIVDASPISTIDSTAITTLRDLDQELDAEGISLFVCCAIGPIRDILAKEGLMSDPSRHHMDVHSAVQYINDDILPSHHRKATQNNI